MVLSNDKILSNTLKLPKSKVETDSYIAVQLLEHKGNLSMDSIKFMAESVEGSFSFSILDDHNNLYIVKGDSPISILHFKDLKLFVFASTDKILWNALINSPLFENLKKSWSVYIAIVTIQAPPMLSINIITFNLIVSKVPTPIPSRSREGHLETAEV